MVAIGVGEMKVDLTKGRVDLTSDDQHLHSCEIDVNLPILFLLLRSFSVVAMGRVDTDHDEFLSNLAGSILRDKCTIYF